MVNSDKEEYEAINLWQKWQRVKWKIVDNVTEALAVPIFTGWVIWVAFRGALRVVWHTRFSK